MSEARSLVLVTGMDSEEPSVSVNLTNVTGAVLKKSPSKKLVLRSSTLKSAASQVVKSFSQQANTQSSWIIELGLQAVS
jgi:hypothetical protein